MGVLSCQLAALGDARAARCAEQRCAQQCAAAAHVASLFRCRTSSPPRPPLAVSQQPALAGCWSSVAGPAAGGLLSAIQPIIILSQAPGGGPPPAGRQGVHCLRGAKAQLAKAQLAQIRPPNRANLHCPACSAPRNLQPRLRLVAPPPPPLPRAPLSWRLQGLRAPLLRPRPRGHPPAGPPPRLAQHPLARAHHRQHPARPPPRFPPRLSPPSRPAEGSRSSCRVAAGGSACRPCAAQARSKALRQAGQKHDSRRASLQTGSRPNFRALTSPTLQH